MQKISLFLITLCSMLVLANCTLLETKMQAIVKNLPNRYCPYRNLDGVAYCPHNGLVQTKSELLLSKMKFPKNTPHASGSSSADLNVGDAAPATQYVDENLSGDPNDDMVEGILDDLEKSQPKATWKSKLSHPRIISGFGFDRISKQMLFPVFPTSDPHGNHHAENRVKAFNSVNEFIDYTIKPKRRFEAGVFVKDINYLRHVAASFGDSTVKLGITQRIHRTHVTNIQSNQALPEFQGAVNSLPPYDRNNPNSKEQYRMLIRFWGTDVATNVRHGGTVHQQTIIKSCFGGNINDGMINDIESAIHRRQPGSGYIRHRKLGVFEARGGNPQLGSDRMVDRINSFHQAPAPIDWDSMPLWEAVADHTRRQWVQAAINDYINENIHTTNQIKHDINQHRINHFKRSQQIYRFSQQIEYSHSPVVFWRGCPHVRLRSGFYVPHCVVLESPIHLAAAQTTNYDTHHGTRVFVERNHEGLTRMRMTVNNHNVYESPWIRTGCTYVRQPGRFCDRRRRCIDYHNVLFRGICIDVIPHLEHYPGHHNQVQRRIVPQCPSF